MTDKEKIEASEKNMDVIMDIEKVYKVLAKLIGIQEGLEIKVTVKKK